MKQGIYLQTCAHIELCTWRIVQMVDGIDPSSRAQIEKFVRLKLNTRNVVARLRQSAVKCYAPLGIRLLLLAERIHSGLPNRNMAAHGAWKLHASGQMEVEHYFTNKAKELRYVSERFGNRAIVAALEDADLILREAILLHEAFVSRNRRYVSFTANNSSQVETTETNAAEVQHVIATVRNQTQAGSQKLLKTSTSLSRAFR